jgi:hypothetical protein
MNDHDDPPDVIRECDFERAIPMDHRYLSATITVTTVTTIDIDRTYQSIDQWRTIKHHGV